MGTDNPPPDKVRDPARRVALGLAAGCLLITAGIAILVLRPFEPAPREAVTGVAILTGLVLIGIEVRHLWRRTDRGRLLWTALMDVILMAAVVLAITPIAAIVRGFFELVGESKARSGADWVAYGFAFTGLFLGAIFFAYAIKYYVSTAIVLITTLFVSSSRNGNSNGNGNGNGNRRKGNGSGRSSGLNRIGGNGNGGGNGYHIDIGYHPFVSVHVAAYNEKRVIERLLTALEKLDYPEYEVVLVDDSTDDSRAILAAWKDRPRFKILYRASRKGFKGGALAEALKLTDPRAEYVVVFDADSVPFPDSIDRFLPHFYQGAGNGNGNGASVEAENGKNGNGAHEKAATHEIRRREDVAAVQSYQWHVLNKSESWLTEAVRAEYAGSYMVERPFQDAVGSLKMIAGTAYMIRADILREVGWGTSLTEDWELTLKLYARGYKVVYTPWAETPAECVGTFSRLARQRMRWAEGHTFNVRKWFVPIMLSPFITPIEKAEFMYDSTYYLQAGLFVIGTVSWLVSEVFFHSHVPGWTATLGWSLLFSNIGALPLMNLGGLILEEAPPRDLQGVLGALVLSFALVPFQAWAAFKGLLSKEEGPWFRTPKTGHITDPVKHLRRLDLLRRWLLGPRAHTTRKPPSGPPSGPPSAPIRTARHNRKLGWVTAGTLVVALAALAWGSMKAPVVEAAGNPLYLHGTGTAPGCAPGAMDPTVGARTPACRFNDAIGVFSFTNLPAQTVAAGVWSFTMYWTPVGPIHLSNISLSVGVAAGPSCAGFVATIPNGGTTWTTTYGALGAHTTSPFTVSTSAGQAALVIPAGGSLCLRVDISVEQDDEPMLYDGPAGVADTRLIPPTTVVPESLLGFLGVALVIPLVTSRRLRSLFKVRS
jgi:cellulose synthase/poly-beta-1,6-N-acetylglucosamine synthase-like glycosyltransferase